MADDDHPEPDRSVFRRHPVVFSLIAVVLLLVGGTVGVGVYLNSQLSNIQTYNSKIPTADRVPRYTPPKDAPAAAGDADSDEGAQNILLLGADNGNKANIAEVIKKGSWDPGTFRSDTIMLVHIPSNRSKAYVVSIPRDSYVEIPGYGTTKVNAAFSYGGPDLAIQTIEQLTQVHIDHVVMVDWDGLRALTTELGGVPVTIPATVTDANGKVLWQKGTELLSGDRALAYVRERYNLPGGDFDRIKRQQNFLRAVMEKTVDKISITNIGQVTSLLKIFTKNSTVDSTFTPKLIRDLAWSMNDLDSKDIVFMTAPVGSSANIDGADVLLLDQVKSKALWTTVREDRVADYIKRYNPELLGGPDTVR